MCRGIGRLCEDAAQLQEVRFQIVIFKCKTSAERYKITSNVFELQVWEEPLHVISPCSSCNLHATDHNRTTPLHWAAAANQPGLIQLLLRYAILS